MKMGYLKDDRKPARLKRTSVFDYAFFCLRIIDLSFIYYVIIVSVSSSLLAFNFPNNLIKGVISILENQEPSLYLPRISFYLFIVFIYF